MDRTYLDDADVGVGTTKDAVLVCATDGTDRTRLASVLREEYPVRTADSEDDALASIDENVTVLVVDLTSDEFSLDRIRERGRERDLRFQVAALTADDPPERLRGRCDAIVQKPADDKTLQTTVRRLHRRGRYDKSLSAYYALSEKYAAVVTAADADPDAMQALERELRQLREQLDDVGDVLDDEDALEVALAPEPDVSPDA